MLQELLLKHAGNLSWTLQHKSRVPWMSTSGVDDCRDSQRNPGRWAIIPILDKGDQQSGSYLRGCTGAISKKKSAHAVWRILHENSETPPSSGIHRSQQYHHRLHPGPARLTWTYLSSYIRIAGNAGMYLLLLLCPSHNFRPLAGACLCPLCHCDQVVSRTGLV